MSHLSEQDKCGCLVGIDGYCAIFKFCPLHVAAPRMLEELRMLLNEYNAGAIDEHTAKRIRAILRDVEGESND